MKKKTLLILAGVFLLLSILAPYDSGGVYNSNALEELPAIGTMENLKTLLKESNKNQNQRFTYRGSPGIMETTMAEIGDAGSSAQNTKAAAAVDEYSATNVQVQGVDEADIVKTDGDYIYQVNNKQVMVIDVKDPKNMKIASKIIFDEAEFYPSELYVEDAYLTVIGYSSLPVRFPEPMVYDSAEPNNKVKILPEGKFRYPYYTGTVSIKVYDISDKTKVKEVREIRLEGNYLSSRMIDENLYLVANRALDYYGITERGEDGALYFKDSHLGNEIQSIGLQDIQYFPDAVAPNYITILGLDLKDLDKKANIHTYLGQGSNIYSSSENMYVAVNRYEENPEAAVSEQDFIKRDIPWYSNYTEIYKFELKDSSVIYQAKGKAPGQILNQFSMDEDRGYFRIATTTGETWRTDEFTSKNNVYIMDKQMEITGKLEGIAPTEKIYSVRFMGDKGYMVTFRQTDPFYVLDLKDPKEPKVLGYLKIPGYSDYLHPYDENYIIGFGKEVVEVKGNAFQAGMKVAVFDVRDVTSPIEKFKIEIGDRGTESPLLHDHKALLFSKEKELLAFPVTVIENRESGKNEWGQFTFQGAYIYQLDMENGFRLKVKITHLTNEDYLKAGNYWYDSEKNVNRILYIGDSLYTLSNGRIEAHKLNNMKLQGYLNLK